MQNAAGVQSTPDSAPVVSILNVTYLACKIVIVMGYTPTVAKVIFLQTLASDMELI